MEFIKHKLGIAFLILCLIAVAAVIWYLVASMPDGGEMSGTLVEGVAKMGVVGL